MILDVSNEAFRRIMNDEALFLPIRWDGVDFSSTVRKLFRHYSENVKTIIVSEVGPEDARIILEKLQTICDNIVESIDYYLNGFPAKAYNAFGRVMAILADNQLLLYQKSSHDPIYFANGNDPLELYRAVKVDDNKPYDRTRVFHTPFSMRSKVSTCRYSIAGHPSLYLCTSLDLCCSEINVDPSRELTLAAAFRMDRYIRSANVEIRVIELGIKPQDIVVRDFNDQRKPLRKKKRNVPTDIMWDADTVYAYLLWFPLIAACSYIRVNKKDPFAAEYIIPQLLMQWVRNVNENLNKSIPEQSLSSTYKVDGEYGKLFGIRYFSCASKNASEKGFNYVFPTNGQKISQKKPYCTILAQAFKLTEPVYIHEYDSNSDCEKDLQNKKFGKLH